MSGELIDERTMEYRSFTMLFGCVWMAPAYVREFGTKILTLQIVPRNGKRSLEIMLLRCGDDPEPRRIYVIDCELELHDTDDLDGSSNQQDCDQEFAQRTTARRRLQTWFIKTFWPAVFWPRLEFEIRILPSAIPQPVQTTDAESA